MSPDQDKVSYWKTDFTQMQVIAFSGCTCVKFNYIEYRGDQTIWLNGPLWYYFIISC